MLKIYNLLGTELVTLVNEEPHEPGFYDKVIDLRSLASAVYFYWMSVTGAPGFEAPK